MLIGRPVSFSANSDVVDSPERADFIETEAPVWS
jgi:hypothetical protein